MSLMEELNKTLEKEVGVAQKDHLEFYDTGIHALDWNNAQYDRDIEGFVKGITSGSLNTFIGRSGSGKTTLAVQIATTIADQYEDAGIFHFDFEHSTPRQRIMSISGWDSKKMKEKYSLLYTGITAESFYKTIKSINTVKQKRRDEIAYDTGMKDEDGNPIMELPPTFVILDSIATMFSDKNAEEEEMGGQMSTTAQAKTNNQIAKRLTGSSTLTDGNIIILAINHITTKIDINPFAKTPADINYLKPDESMPGKLVTAWGVA